jgi:hypothetical protein
MLLQAHAGIHGCASVYTVREIDANACICMHMLPLLFLDDVNNITVDTR